MTFADEAASCPSRRSNVSLSRAGSRWSPHDCPSKHDCLFLSKRGGLLFSTKAILWDIVCQRRWPPHSSLCAPSSCRAHQNFALRSHYPSCRDRDLGLQCAGRFFGMGDTPFVRKTRHARKVMTVQNWPMKGLPMRRALTTGVVRRSNICGPASSRGRAILLRVQMDMGVSSQNSTLRRTERG
jgi:hypothetical protein